MCIRDRYGAEAIKVDDAAIDISKLSSSGQMVHLEFSLSLEQVDKTQSYYLEIKAPQNSDNTITWYGSKNVDNLATLYNGTAVAGDVYKRQKQYCVIKKYLR